MRVRPRGGALGRATSPPADDPQLQAGDDPTRLNLQLTTYVSDPAIKRAATTPDGGSAANGTSSGGASGTNASADAGATAPPANQCQCVTSLDFKSSGAIAGSFGIGDYWPGVTKYWGGDKTLGSFDTAASGGAHTYGHKFQVVGEFKNASTTGAAAAATFTQNARLTTGTAPPGVAGSWFNDMDYTDAGGGVHHWDPNAEAGTATRAGYPGVRRTLAPGKVAYTDPPAIGYTPGSTETYRKLEFDIHWDSAPGCNCNGILGFSMQRVQEIRLTKGVPTTVAFP
jgi:hypothetical protein